MFNVIFLGNLITNITVVDDSEYPINQLVDGNFITCQQVFMNNNDRLAWVRIIIPKYISLVTAIKVTRSSTHPLLDVYVWNIVLDRSNSSLKCLSQNSFSPSYQICNGALSGKYVSLFGAETSFQVCEIELYGTGKKGICSLFYFPRNKKILASWKSFIEFQLQLESVMKNLKYSIKARRYCSNLLSYLLHCFGLHCHVY